MINNIFDKQPHYWQDLTQAIKGIVEVHVHVCTMYVCMYNVCVIHIYIHKRFIIL